MAFKVNDPIDPVACKSDVFSNTMLLLSNLQSTKVSVLSNNFTCKADTDIFKILTTGGQNWSK